jgi:hypothetical protein
MYVVILKSLKSVVLSNLYRLIASSLESNEDIRKEWTIVFESKMQFWTEEMWLLVLGWLRDWNVIVRCAAGS